MNQTERLYKIDQLLQHRKLVSFAELQAELEVSRATLKRDLAYLRDRLHAPVEWSRAQGGYRLANKFNHPGVTSAPPAATRHELPGLWFSAAEIYALLTMEHLLAGLAMKILPTEFDGQSIRRVYDEDTEIWWFSCLVMRC